MFITIYIDYMLYGVTKRAISVMTVTIPSDERSEKMKKELYTEAELEVVRFDNDDVITESPSCIEDSCIDDDPAMPI